MFIDKSHMMKMIRVRVSMDVAIEAHVAFTSQRLVSDPRHHRT